MIRRQVIITGLERIQPSHVVDPASIATSRRRRRAKTDRIDGEARGRGPPPLPRAQGPDRRAGPARQSRQGTAVLTGDIWLRTAAPRPALVRALLAYKRGEPRVCA